MNKKKELYFDFDGNLKFLSFFEKAFKEEKNYTKKEILEKCKKSFDYLFQYYISELTESEKQMILFHYRKKE